MTRIKKEKVNPLFDPRSCTYKLSGKIRNHVEKLVGADDVDKTAKDILLEIMDEEEANKNTLTYDSLVKLHKYLQRVDENYTEPFYLLSESCKCIEPKARDNKQLDARLKVLRLRASQSMYDSMTVSVDRAVEDKVEKLADNGHVNHDQNGIEKCQASEIKKLNGSLVAVFNSFLVFICTFIFCYKALEYSLPNPDVIAQTIFGLIGSTVVAIAELYFLLRVV